MRYYLGKTRHGNYEVRWTENGQGRSSSLRTKDKKLAEERLEQFAAEHSKPVHQIKTICDPCDAYYDEMKHGYQYPSQVNDKFKPIKVRLGNLLVTQVNNEKALNIIIGKNCANSTVDGNRLPKSRAKVRKKTSGALKYETSTIPAHCLNPGKVGSQNSN